MTQKTGKHTKREQDYHMKILAKLNQQQQPHEKPQRTLQNNQGRRK